MARARVARLETRHDVAVTWRPYELHPEIPDGGQVITRRFSAVAPHAEQEGLVLRPPHRLRPSRRAHQAALLVEERAPVGDAATFHDRLYDAVWVEERDIEDPLVLAELAAGLDVDPAEVAEVAATESRAGELSRSIDDARGWGLMGTPGWLFDERFELIGLQDDAVLDRIVTRLGRGT